MAICTNSANNQLLRPLIKVNQVGSTGGSSPSCVLVEGFLQTIAAGRAATNNTRPCPGSSLISYALRNGTSMSHSTFLGVHKCSRVPDAPVGPLRLERSGFDGGCAAFEAKRFRRNGSLRVGFRCAL
jgi:hypothetical protein